MAITHINVNAHREYFGRTEENHSKIARNIRSYISRILPEFMLETLDIYAMKGAKHSHRVGGRRRHAWFINSTYLSNENRDADVIEHQVPLAFGDVVTNITKTLPPSGQGIIIKSTNGIPIAEWIESRDEDGFKIFNILFDLFPDNADINYTAFEYIVNAFKNEVLAMRERRNSWIHSDQKEQLTQIFTESIKRGRTARIEDDKRQMRSYENAIRDYTTEIKRKSDQLIAMRIRVDADERNLNAVDEKLIKDLDNIVAHEKIKDLHIKNNKFIIHTVPLYFYDDREDTRYYGGSYRIEINPDNTDVKFFGDNPRQGYWTEQDPHPHVSGSSGGACLGNVSSTIAELCSQMEIYALALVTIDFLESVNSNDPAGAKCVNWDVVNEEGEVIEEATGERDVTWTCEHCDESMTDDDESTTVYQTVNGEGGDAEAVDPIDVCDECRFQHYHWSDHFNGYVHDDYSDEDYEEEA